MRAFAGSALAHTRRYGQPMRASLGRLTPSPNDTPALAMLGLPSRRGPYSSIRQPA